jgi:hypothetical protein
MPGHWDRDFIKGAGNKSSMGVLFKRTNRLVLLARTEDPTAASELSGSTANMHSIAAPIRHSLTYCQGKEMARHRAFTASTGVKVHFCDPHSTWQRGSCENANGLLRQHLPKGTDLSIQTQADLDAHRRQPDQPTTRHVRLSHPAGGVRRDDRGRSSTLNIRPMRRMLQFGLETAEGFPCLPGQATTGLTPGATCRMYCWPEERI